MTGRGRAVLVGLFAALAVVASVRMMRPGVPVDVPGPIWGITIDSIARIDEIEQAMGTLAIRGRTAEAFFLRTKDGDEVDLVLDLAGERWAVEIKLTASPSPADLARLDKHAELIGAGHRVLVSRMAGVHGGQGRFMADLPGFLSLLRRA